MTQRTRNPSRGRRTLTDETASTIPDRNAGIDPDHGPVQMVRALRVLLPVRAHWISRQRNASAQIRNTYLVCRPTQAHALQGLHDKRLCAVWNYENAEGIMTAYKNDNAHVAKAGSLFVHFCNAADCKEMGFVRLQNDIWTAVVLSRS